MAGSSPEQDVVLRSAEPELTSNLGAPTREAGLQGKLDVLTVSFASAYANERSPDAIRQLAEKCLVAWDIIGQDHADLLRGARARVRNAEVLRRFKKDGTGVIICSFHLGPFMYVPAEAAQCGFDVQMVVDKESATEAGAGYQRIATVIKTHLELLIAEEPRSLLRGLRSVRKGGLLFFYIDGNTGSGGAGGGVRHGADMHLLSMPVRLRTGIAYLAQKAQAPIVIGLAYRDGGGERTVEFLEPIPPPKDTSDDARRETTIQIWKRFEDYLRKYPEQWDGWFRPVYFWPEITRSPVARVADLKSCRDRVLEAMKQPLSEIRCKADPLRVGVWRSGAGSLILDGRGQRVLGASALAYDILQAALRGISICDLPRELASGSDALSDEVAKLYLAGILKLDGFEMSS